MKDTILQIIKDYQSDKGVLFSAIKEAYQTASNLSPEEIDEIGVENFHTLCKIYSHILPGRYLEQYGERKLLLEVTKEQEDQIAIKMVGMVD